MQCYYCIILVVPPTKKNDVLFVWPFLCTGIDVVVMPATPRDSPLGHAKPVIAQKPKDLELMIGDTANFELVVEDKTGVAVSWFKDGKLLLGCRRIKIWDEGQSFFMKIQKLLLSDEALYECKVRNEWGEVMCDVELLVNEESDSEGFPAKFTKKLPKEVKVIEGDPLKLEVKVDGDPTPTVAWYYGDKKLKSSEFIRISGKKITHKLEIDEAFLEDEGFYKCVAKNEFGSDKTETEILVDQREEDTKPEPEKEESKPARKSSQEKPEVMIHLKDRDAIVGDQVEFRIKVVGNPPPKVEWFVNENRVSKTDKRMKVGADEEIHSLVIGGVRLSDEGEVKAVCTNSAGSYTDTCELLVEGR